MTADDDQVLRDHLDPDQFEVACITGRNILVLAPPGSGKTRVLVHAAAHRVRHGAELKGRQHVRTMCLTFGVDAAREMRTRLVSAPLFVPASRAWVGNYHQLGSYLLRRYGHQIGWPRDAGLVPAPANEAIVAEAIRDVGVHEVSARNVASAISAIKGRREAGDVSQSLLRIKERYDDLLEQRHLRDFDDLITHAIRLLRENPRIARVIHDAYPYLFIDELQDTNLLQLEFLKALAGSETRLFAVADDDQMIYGWRDAHPGNIDEYVATFGAAELPLIGNYRCPPRIVDAANQLIQLNSRRRIELMESRVDDLEGEVIIVGARSMSQGEVVATEVARSIEEGTKPGEIAILAPHRFKFPEVALALDDRSIPHVSPGGDAVKSVPIVRLLQLGLRVIAGGIVGPDDCTDLFHKADLQDVASRLVEIAGKAGEGPPRGMLNRLLGGLGLGTVRAPKQSSESVHLLATMFRKAVDEESPSSSADLASVLLLSWDRLEAAALRAEQAVKLMTSFTAKGTEYPIVMLPFMDAGLVPYARRGERIDWQESRRIFYVALTRAERRVVIIHDADSEPSELLEAIRDRATAIYEA